MASPLLALSLVLAQTAVVSETRLAPDLLVRPIAPGFWLHVSEREDGVPSNGLLVALGEDAMLVDTPWNDAQTERLCAWAESALHRRVTSAVATHSHSDRLGGLGALRARGVRMGALDLTAAKAAANPAGAPEVLLTARAAILRDPRGFEVFYPGPGHTTDNVVVYFSKQRLLFGGCLVKSEAATDMGYVGEADLAAWPRAIAALEKRYPEARLVVPGHGPLGGARAAFERTLQLLREYRPPRP